MNYLQEVIKLKADRDYLLNRLRIQQDLHESQDELLRLNNAHVDSMRERLNEFEQLLSLVPGCEGEFEKAKTWVLSHLPSVQTFGRGASSLSPRNAGADQAEHRAECMESRRENLCVSSVRDNPEEDTTELWCSNCGLQVAFIHDQDRTEKGLVTPGALKEFWRDKWELHTQVQGRVDLIAEAKAQLGEKNLAGAGVGSSLAAASGSAAEPASANPTGARFPNGRYASSEKGGV
jgi:hypothetical protein